MNVPVETIRLSFRPLYANLAGEHLELRGPGGYILLRDFQKSSADLLQGGGGGITLLTAPTGSGKTLSLLLGPREEYLKGGVTGLYPNNELLVDQARGVERVLVDSLGLRRVHSSTGDFLQSLDLDFFNHQGAPPYVYAVYEGPLTTPWGSLGRVGILLASGRTLSRDPPRLVSKLQSLQNAITRINDSGVDYLIVLATPDTMFLNLVGAYGGFSDTGRLLAALMQGEVRVEELVKQGLHRRIAGTRDVVNNLLCRPLFVDEFHLYDATMVDSLASMILVLRDMEGLCDNPVLLSSATPSPLLLGELENLLSTKALRVSANYSEHGDPGELVSGEMDVSVHLVPAQGRGGAAYYQAGALVGEGVRSGWLNMGSFIANRLPRGERGIVITEKVAHAIEAVEAVRETHGLTPRLKVSIVPPHLRGGDNRLMVGSAAITQGVDHPNVTYGVVSRATWENALQAKGRVARRVRAGELHLVVPFNNRTRDAAGSYEATKLDYQGQEKMLRELLPSQEPFLQTQFRAYGESLRRLRREAAVTLAKVGKDVLLRNREALGRSYSLAHALRGIGVSTRPPEALAGLVSFRSVGLGVSFLLGDVELEADLGTLQRNFNLRIDSQGKIVAEGLGRGELALTCSWSVERAMARLTGSRRPPFLVPLATLVETADCRLTDGMGGASPVPRDPTLMVLVARAQGDLGELLVAQGRALRLPNDLIAVYV